MEKEINNKVIKELSTIAIGLGLKVVITSWNTSTDVSFTMQLGNNRTYSFYISVSPDADAREISDKLYEFVDFYNKSFSENGTITTLKELGHTDEEIDAIYRTMNILLKNNSSLRESRLGLID